MKYKDFYQHILLEYNKDILPNVFDALEKTSDDLAGVHFSRGIVTGKTEFGSLITTPHLGFNKDPSHSDPIGIYVFPKTYVLSGGLSKNTGFYSSEYYYIIEPNRAKCRILNLSTLTESKMVDLIKRMEIPESYITDEKVYHRNGSKAGHKLWGIMEKYRNDTEHSNYSWNKLFKKSGYNVILDEGDKIVHSNEPYQMIYLEPETYKIIDQGGKTKEPKIFSDVIKAFPHLQAKQGRRAYGRTDTRTIQLIDPKNPSFSISIQWHGTPPEIYLNIYGRTDNKTGHSDNFSKRFDDRDKNLTSKNVIDAINAYIENSTLVKNPYTDHDLLRDLNGDQQDLVKKMCDTYGFKYNSEHPLNINRIYFDKLENMRVKMDITVGNDIVLRIERHRHYSISNYFFSGEVDFNDYKDKPAQDIIDELLKKLLENIDKDKYIKEYNKEDARKFVEILKRRVFVVRKS